MLASLKQFIIKLRLCKGISLFELQLCSICAYSNISLYCNSEFRGRGNQITDGSDRTNVNNRLTLPDNIVTP